MPKLRRSFKLVYKNGILVTVKQSVVYLIGSLLVQNVWVLYLVPIAAQHFYCIYYYNYKT